MKIRFETLEGIEYLQSVEEYSARIEAIAKEYDLTDTEIMLISYMANQKI